MHANGASMCKSGTSDALALSQHQTLKNRAFAAATLNQRSVLGDCFAVFAQNRAVSVSEIVRKFRLLLRRFRGREFLKARIIPKRIEHGIEPEQRGRERHARTQWASVRYRE